MSKGRPREFDRELALESAVHVFWRKGYRGTSLDDLTEAMNIGRPSLYGAFGDKEALFLESIDYYRMQMVVPRFQKLLTSATLAEGLPAFFRGFGKLVTGKEMGPGCMIACLLAEECCESETIREKFATIIAGSDGAFTRLFESRKAELRPGLEPESAGRLMTSVMQGLALRARAGASLKDLADVGDVVIRLVLG